MNVRLSPTKLKGSITIPPSKSMSHRALICAALSEGESVVENIILSDDIKATISAMSELGANFKVVENQVHVSGITIPPSVASIDCNESGSTLRFIIPIAAALGVATTFFGNGKLPERPITPFLRELPKKNIAFAYNGTMPFAINGMLKAGTYELEGDISSQFISGLLFSLPLLDGDSQINLTSPLQSKPYVDMTIDCMNKYGVQVTESEDKYLIEGNQIYSLDRFEVEGDYSQAAFFLVANALGSDIQCGGLDKDSLQGDKKIIEIIDSIKRDDGSLSPFNVDVGEIPDLVPILSVLASFCDGKSTITNAARLRIKECDRLEAMQVCINAIGGEVTSTEDSLIIKGVSSFKGGIVDSYNDHRIAMAMAIASTKCENELTINGAECVEKSYPHFFEDIKKLGGILDLK